jgi:acyl carrier protein
MNKLTKVFCSVLNIEESEVTADLSPDTNPAWDSLNSIVLITEIEKALGVKFEPSEAASIKNYADAEKLVIAKGADLAA